MGKKYNYITTGSACDYTLNNENYSIYVFQKMFIVVSDIKNNFKKDKYCVEILNKKGLINYVNDHFEQIFSKLEKNKNDIKLRESATNIIYFLEIIKDVRMLKDIKNKVITLNL